MLVDTHALLWWLSDDAALSPAARADIGDPANEPLVSAASVWEKPRETLSFNQWHDDGRLLLWQSDLR